MNSTKNRIQIFLNSKNWSQYRFSHETGVDAAIVSRILNGKCEPTAQTLRKIAEATNVSPEWLLGFGTDNNIIFLKED